MHVNLSARSGAHRITTLAAESLFGKDRQPKPGAARALERAIDVQRPLVLANLRRLRRRNPSATIHELAHVLGRDYLRTVTATGAAVGTTAAVPGVGTVAALGLSTAATVAFLEATALYAQSIAELHGVTTHDPERSRTMVMAVLMGEEGISLVNALLSNPSGRGAPEHWGKVVGQTAPASVIRSLAGTLRRRFLRRLLARQGSALIGRALPLGVGAVVGGAGNHMMGKAVIRATHSAFGELPTAVPGELESDILAADGAGETANPPRA